MANKDIKNAYLISHYYGFEGLDLEPITKEEVDVAKSIKKGIDYDFEGFMPVEEKLAVLKTYQNNRPKDPRDPLLIYHEGKIPNKTKKTKADKELSLHIIGSPRSVSDAMLIKTIHTILNEEGYKDISVEINSVGGKDSANQFSKELGNFFRKHVNNMNATCRKILTNGPHALISCDDKFINEISEEAPSSLNYLDDESKKHFGEFIEFLESQEIPYNINKRVVGHPNYSSETVFKVVDNKTGKILATGSRFSNIAKKYGIKEDIVGISSVLKLKKLKSAPVKKLPKKEKFYLIQIGNQAKQKALSIIEELRKVKIPIHQSISRDKLSTQLQIARRKRFPYVIIIGQKEACENCAIVRSTKDNNQKIVSIPELPKYLKSLK